MKKLLFSVLIVLSLILPAFAFAAEKESAYDRVMRTGAIRCGYASWAPSIVINPNTGKISGIYYDLVNKIGEALKLKIEWVEEVGYGQIIEGFKAGRYDMFCGAVSPTPERSRQAVFSIPTYYSPIGIWVRNNDTRFDQDYKKLNNLVYKIATKDGDLQESIADADFPKAKKVSIPQMVDTSQNLQDVANGKADAVFVEPYYAFLFLEKNPHALKNIVPNNPIRLFPNVLMMPAQEFQLKVMIDTVMQELLNRGELTKLVEKYTGRSDTYLLVAKPYEVSK